MANPNQNPPNPNPILAPLLQNLFQYRDQNNQLQTLNLPGPASISRHCILYPNRWIPVPTVDGLVTQGWENFICAVCGRWGHSTRANGLHCLGPQCVAAFNTLSIDCETNRIEIRTTAAMGLGIFARTNIDNGRVLGEYLGDLRPLNDDPDNIDHYQFTMAGVAVISATEAGNWARFMNHSCNPNVTASDDMYGRRRAIVFKTNRLINAGEQLTIHYGDEYFEPLQIDCTCDTYPGPHQPGGRPAQFQQPRTPELEPVVVSLGTPIPPSPGQFLPYTASQFQQIPRRPARRAPSPGSQDYIP